MARGSLFAWCFWDTGNVADFPSTAPLPKEGPINKGYARGSGAITAIPVHEYSRTWLNEARHGWHPGGMITFLANYTRPTFIRNLRRSTPSQFFASIQPFQVGAFAPGGCKPA